ncbi:MAG TPA: DUF3500 domain-containing protein [Chloroflexota bacterium]|nr:DUF3500 domain-containing protein [Chloroflexota bacterium]
MMTAEAASAEFTPRKKMMASARHAFPMIDRIQGMFERAKKGIEEPFTGVTIDGQVQPGLFGLQETGVPTRGIRQAAERFLSLISAEQRAQACFPLDANEWRMWNNTHPFVMRHGVLIEELGDSARDAALGLLRASLSAGGYSLARDIMRLNEFIGDICNGNWDEYGEWLYWVSIFGDPAGEAPWGWQIDGHHLNVNCAIVGDQLVLTPLFMGSEPVTGTRDKWTGISVFSEEEATGEALWASLDAGQREQASLGQEHPSVSTMGAGLDNLVVPSAGLLYPDMTARQRALLEEVIDVYVGRIRRGHAAVRWQEVRRHLDGTSFGWIARADADDTFYYRVQSPVLLIEFDHQSGVALADDHPTRKHIHTIVRTPNGNDYGKDLLRQHYLTSPHHHQLAK